MFNTPYKRGDYGVQFSCLCITSTSHHWYPIKFLVALVFAVIERRNSCRFNLYAIWMAVAHNMQLIVNTLIDDFLGRGLKYATQCKHSIQVDIQSSFICKTLTYLTDASALIAAFILMLFSVDRVCSIYNPKHFEQSSHMKLAHIIIAFVSFICLILNIPHLIFADLKIHPTTNSRECQYINPVAGGVKYVLYLYIVGVAILPAVFIFITNLLILYKLSTAVYRSKLIGAKDDESKNEMGKVVAHLAISILFTCLSIPLVVMIILRQEVHFYKYDILYPDYAKQIVQYSKLFSSVDSFNHAFDFFLYLAFMPTFRHTLWEILTCGTCCRRKQHGNLNQQLMELQNRPTLEQKTSLSILDDETTSLYSNKHILPEIIYVNANGLYHNSDHIPFIDQYTNYSPEHYILTRS
ncbi:unnamed protein product [Heterobilharzia americana]|nr:unnamed protein product [Heterobilharzia americana]